jgi:hypothetical protein
MTAADAAHAPPAIIHLSADEIRRLDPYGFLAVPATAAERQP